MNKYQVGDKVWVSGLVVAVRRGKPQVRFFGHQFLESAWNDGEIKLTTVVTPKQIKPDVTFPWSPAKAKKKVRVKK